jgi:hypothetical protein
MLLYITATTQVVSAALVVEREEPVKMVKVQQAIYFVSKVLSNKNSVLVNPKVSICYPYHQA